MELFSLSTTVLEGGEEAALIIYLYAILVVTYLCVCVRGELRNFSNSKYLPCLIFPIFLSLSFSLTRVLLLFEFLTFNECQTFSTSSSLQKKCFFLPSYQHRPKCA